MSAGGGVDPEVALVKHAFPAAGHVAVVVDRRDARLPALDRQVLAALGRAAGPVEPGAGRIDRRVVGAVPDVRRARILHRIRLQCLGVDAFKAVRHQHVVPEPPLSRTGRRQFQHHPVAVFLPFLV